MYNYGLLHCLGNSYIISGNEAGTGLSFDLRNILIGPQLFAV